MYNQDTFSENALYKECKRIDIYKKEVEDAAKDRLESIRLNKENAAKTLVSYNKMLYLGLVQTILMFTQTLLFAGIYFKL